MKKPRPPLLIFHHDPGVQARVRQAAERGSLVRIVSSWERLAQALRAAPLTAVALVDPHAGTDGALAPELRAILRAFPCAVVVATVHTRRSSAADLRTLGEWGVAEVIAEDQDGAPEIARVLDAVRERPLHALIESYLPDELAPDARAILAAAADTAVAGGGARELARQLHVSVRTLVRRCERAALPCPRQLLGWMRILLAAELMEDPTRPMDSIALACGYASDAGLRRALRDFVHSNPRTMRKAAPFAVASRAFLQALGGGRFRPVPPAPLPACLCQGRPQAGVRTRPHATSTEAGLRAPS
jgi:AraC-like DNA-binding protein